jgi:hypothetical protein
MEPTGDFPRYFAVLNYDNRWAYRVVRLADEPDDRDARPCWATPRRAFRLHATLGELATSPRLLVE